MVLTGDSSKDGAALVDADQSPLYAALSSGW
jgi:hypothetical protein